MVLDLMIYGHIETEEKSKQNVEGNFKTRMRRTEDLYEQERIF